MISKLIKKIRTEPVYAIQIVYSVIYGGIISSYYNFIRKNVTIKSPFKVFGKVRIVGPGTVFIDKNCMVSSNVFKGLTIITLNKKSVVHIGKNCILGGLTIRTANKVVIKDDVMTALSLIQDVNFIDQEAEHKVQTQINKNKDNKVENKEIVIGKGVWIGGQAIVLGDAKCQDYAVMGSGAVLKQMDLNEFSVGIGNPVRRGVSIEKLLRLMKND